MPACHWAIASQNTGHRLIRLPRDTTIGRVKITHDVTDADEMSASVSFFPHLYDAQGGTIFVSLSLRMLVELGKTIGRSFCQT